MRKRGPGDVIDAVDLLGEHVDRHLDQHRGRRARLLSWVKARRKMPGRSLADVTGSADLVMLRMLRLEL